MSYENDVQIEKTEDQHHVDGVFMVLDRLLRILYWVLVIPLFTLLIVITGYVTASIITDIHIRNIQQEIAEKQIMQRNADHQDINVNIIPYESKATQRIESLVTTLWDKALPVGNEIVRLFAPILVLLLLVAGLRAFIKSPLSTEKIAKLFPDIPSILAVIIIAGIFLIPFTGVVVPEALSNIALVVVGFYFGRGKNN